MILSYPHTQKRKERVETRSSIAILAAGFEVWGQPLSRRSAGLSTKGGGKKKEKKRHHQGKQSGPSIKRSTPQRQQSERESVLDTT